MLPICLIKNKLIKMKIKRHGSVIFSVVVFVLVLPHLNDAINYTKVPCCSRRQDLRFKKMPEIFIIRYDEYITTTETMTKLQRSNPANHLFLNCIQYLILLQKTGKCFFYFKS